MRYWLEKQGEGSAVTTRAEVSNTTQSLLISRLKPFTLYVIEVKALGFWQEIKGQARISTDEGGMDSHCKSDIINS